MPNELLKKFKSIIDSAENGDEESINFLKNLIIRAIRNADTKQIIFFAKNVLSFGTSI